MTPNVAVGTHSRGNLFGLLGSFRGSQSTESGVRNPEPSISRYNRPKCPFCSTYAISSGFIGDVFRVLATSEEGGPFNKLIIQCEQSELNAVVFKS